MNEKSTTELLQELLAAYGESEPMQSYKDSSTDNQLNSIALVLQELISKTQTGTVLDIGCGTGILLSKLTEIKAFMNSRDWLYIGADFNNLDKIIQLAVEMKIHRKCDVMKLESLYSDWLNNADAAKPLLIFLRNVLHELDIPSTAKLLQLLSKHMQSEDTLLIQDLLVFPLAERGNVCWDSGCLEKVLDQIGFEPNPTTVKSKSGAQWVSVLVRKKDNSPELSLVKIRDIVAEARIEQLKKWHSLKKFPCDIRHREVAILDFDLQLSALYEQLNDTGYLSVQQQQGMPSPDPQKAFQLALSKYDPSILDRDRFKLPSLHNFRDRADSQDSLEKFLTTQETVVVIQGGNSCGKTVLISHVLSKRAHERSVVPIDCATTNDVWPILEQYLLSIGCPTSVDILSHEKDLSFIQPCEELRKIVTIVSPKTIVVLDHFENLLDPNGNIMNAEIRDFLTLVASSNKAKLILTTRRRPVLDFFPDSVEIAQEQPPIGRFPRGPHVQNILDDYVDRASIGLDEYPDELLNSIDRFPYLATLAGKLIAKAGINIAYDPMILQSIRSYLYDELIQKIVSPAAKTALDLACLLRIPTPISLYENIVGKEATTAALETGILFNVPDRYRSDLLFCAAILRDSELSHDPDENDANSIIFLKEKHGQIAEYYKEMSYDALGDPRWIREAHYHYLASGNLSALDNVGSMYKDEFFWAGQTLFRKFHNYKESLEMLHAAEAMGFVTYESRRLIASCLIRTGNRSSGATYYEKLIADYSSYIGAKTSYIDSLLSIKEYADALNLLKKYGFTNDNATAWILGQLGRSYLGLGEYPQAVNSFELQLNKENNSPSIVYVRLAQAHFRNGDRDNAQKAILRGLEKYKSDPILNGLYYTNLIRNTSLENLQEASKKLNELLIKNPRNGFIIQKLIRISSALGELPQILTYLEKIRWQVYPSYMDVPIKISVLLSHNNFKKALETANQMSDNVEYAIPTIYNIYLLWAMAEKIDEKKKGVAEKGIKLEIPIKFRKNIPVLTMYAQLARIAGNDEYFEQTILLIAKCNSSFANELRISENIDTGDFEPEMP